MAELEPTKQQDFIPPKKPSLWQRFRFWFAALKKWQKSVVVLGVVVIVSLAVLVSAGVIGPISIPPGGPAALRLVPAGSDTMYPNEIQTVGIYLDTGGQDAVAVQAVLSYEPGLFEVSINYNSPVFQTTAPGEGVDPPNGRIELIVGTPGNGDPNNPVTHSDGNASGTNGFNGSDGLVATLVIRATNITPAGYYSPIQFTDASRVIADDGLGTDILGSATGYEWTVIEEPVFTGVLKISEVSIQYLGNGRAEVTWQTNARANSRVCYTTNPSSSDPITDPPDTCVSESEEVRQHSVTITGLAEGMTYYYQIRSQRGLAVSQAPQILDAFIKPVSAAPPATENEAYSRIFSFTVPGAIDIPLNILNLSASESYTSVTLNWNTEPESKPADSQILSCGPGVWRDSLILTLSHQIRVTGLASDTTYTCTVSSTAANGENDTETVTFTTLRGQAPDANVVLKVERDRICDKWLYCRSSMEIVNSQGQQDSLCFDVGICDELGPDGECVKAIDPADDYPGEQIFTHPDNSIQNLSGLSKVGLIWPDVGQFDGYRHYGSMQTQGQDINIANSGFESGEVWPWEKIFTTNISIVNDSFDNTNQVLKISRTDLAGDMWLHSYVPIGWISSDETYAISMGVRTTSGDNKNLRIQFWVPGQGAVGWYDENRDLTQYRLKFQPISNYWQTITFLSNGQGSYFTPDLGVEGYSYLNLAIPADELGAAAIEIDNVSMKSVLEVAASDYRSRSCRLYPTSNAPACDYVDMGGKQYQGWQGFCVEPDPKYVSYDVEKQMCLNWWPVDVLPGETDIFSSGQQAGYIGRQPLYYCLESAGNLSRPFGISTCSGDATGCDDVLYESDCPFVCNWYGGLGSGVAVLARPVRQVQLQDYQLAFLDIRTMSAGDGTFINNITFTIVPNVASDLYKYEIHSISIDGDAGNYPRRLLSSSGSTWQQGTDWFHRAYWQDDNTFLYLLSEHVDDWDNAGGFDSANMVSNCQENDGNKIGFKFVFNSSTGRLDYISGKQCDDENSEGEQDTPAKYINLRLHLLEPCDVLAQVVTPAGQNTAWAERVRQGGWVADNVLDYTYEQDYYPYGAAVVGEPVTDPAVWSQPLYVEPADISSAMQRPYQVRAGSPYSVSSGGATSRECEDTGVICNIDEDCNLPGECALVGGVYECINDSILVPGNSNCYTGLEYRCVGGMYNGATCTIPPGGYVHKPCSAHFGTCDAGTCVAGSEPIDWRVCVEVAYNRQNWLGQSCTDDIDCGGMEDSCRAPADDGECLSTVHEADGTQTIENSDILCMSNVGSCEMWSVEGPDDSKCYVRQSCIDIYDMSSIGTTQCIAGNAETLDMSGCNDNSDCGYSGEGGYGMCIGVNLTDEQKQVMGGGFAAGESRLSDLFAKSYGIWWWKPGVGYEEVSDQDGGTDIYGWDITPNYAINKPKVTNIKVNGQSSGNINLPDPGSVILTFNSQVDDNHLPLVALRVDWADGTPETRVTNLSINARGDENNPHVLTHTYECSTGTCYYVPTIQIQDNWGWCNNGYYISETDYEKCPANIVSGERFDGIIEIIEQEVTP